MTCRCKKRGHLARVCRSQPKVASPNFQGVPSRKRPPQSVRQVSEESDEDSKVDSIQHLCTVEPGRDAPSRSPPIKVHVELDSCKVSMEVDTGATVSIITEALYRKLWPRRGLAIKTTNVLSGTY